MRWVGHGMQGHQHNSRGKRWGLIIAGFRGQRVCVPGQGIPGLAGDTGARERRRGILGWSPRSRGLRGSGGLAASRPVAKAYGHWPACRTAVYLPRLAHHGWRLRACSPWMAACRLPLAACRRQGPDLSSRRLGQPAAACPALCFTPGCGGVWRQIGTVAVCLYRRARSGLRSRVAACFTASPWLRIRLATVRGRWPGCCRLSGRRRASGRVH